MVPPSPRNVLGSQVDSHASQLLSFNKPELVSFTRTEQLPQVLALFFLKQRYPFYFFPPVGLTRGLATHKKDGSSVSRQQRSEEVADLR